MRWLRELGGGEDAHVRVEPTGAGRVALVTAGDLVVKAGLDAAGRERAARERRALEELREAAAAAGADVPTVVASGPWFVAETAVAGRPPRAHELERVTNDVVRWLAAWNAATAHRGEPDLSGLVRTAERLDVPGEYREWLAALVARLRGRPLLRVAAHNDLTMANVLVSPQRIAIVDWESARADGDPLHDLWYALADACSRARGIPHAEAVEALVAEGAPQVADAAARLSLSEDEALLAFHGCWLAHAADELDRGGPGAFAGVVSRVAALPAARTPFPRPSP
jgi:hypothetical protein